MREIFFVSLNSIGYLELKYGDEEKEEDEKVCMINMD